MFKALIKAINEECARPMERVTKVLAVHLVTDELFNQHGIGVAKASEAMGFVDSHCAELYLVETDLGFVLVDYDADDFQFVIPSIGKGGAHSALEYLYDTAKDLNEDQEETVES